MTLGDHFKARQAGRWQAVPDISPTCEEVSLEGRLSW
jgi:hypothetical protein